MAATVVANQSSIRGQAIMARRSSLFLDTLLRARIDVYTEYVASASIVAAQAYHVSGAELDSLLGLNVQAALVDARRGVDQQKVFAPKGVFASEYAQLQVLRRAVTRGTASPAEVESFFNGFGSTIDALWERTFDSLASSSQSTDTNDTKSRLAALDSSFRAFTSGLGEESLQGGGSLETVLTTPSTPAEIESLIVSHQQFEADDVELSRRARPAGRGGVEAHWWATDSPAASRAMSRSASWPGWEGKRLLSPA